MSVKKMEEVVWNGIKKTLNEPEETFFERLEDLWREYTQRTLYTLDEIKRHNALTEIGTLFEIFCKHWLLNTETHWKLNECYLFRELTPDLKEKLGLLQKVDLGIDLIGVKHVKGQTKGQTKKQEKYIAIQCKFITKPKPNPYKRYNSWTVPWQKMATFNGLVSRTGPNGQNSWFQHWLITNSNGSSRNKNIPKDIKGKTIARATLINTPKSLYYNILEKNNLLNANTTNPINQNNTLTAEEIRQKRIAILSQQ